MLREEMFKLLSKTINVEPIQASLVTDFTQAVNGLEGLMQEIEAKRVILLEKKQLIEIKLSEFKQSGMVNVDDEERKKTNKNVDQFIAILDRMMSEIMRDVKFYWALVSATPPKSVIVMKKDKVDSFGEYIVTRVGIIKRYIKVVRRDISVSFSRYWHGFEMQIKHIMYIEQALGRARKKGELKGK